MESLNDDVMKNLGDISAWSKEDVFNVVKEWAKQHENVKVPEKNPSILSGKHLLSTLEDQSFFSSLFRHYIGDQPDSLFENLLEFFKQYHSSKRAIDLNTFANPREFQQLHRNFLETKFQGNEPQLFLHHLQNCSNAFLNFKTKILSPCVPLLQSSGYGKSRILFELAKRTDVNLVYVCARKVGAQGFPARSTTACSFLNWDSSSVWKGNELSTRETELAQKILAICKCATTANNNPQKQVEWATDQFANNIESFWDAVKNEFNNNRDVPAAPTKTTKDDPFVVLAVDEASTLLDLEIFPGRSMFRGLRVAASKVAQHGFNLVVVLCDTASKVSTFLPSQSTDSSQRYNPDEGSEQYLGRHLLHPFVMYQSFDCLATDHDPLSQGRPLVAECKGELGFLAEKLMCCKNINQAKPEGILALFLACVAAYLSPLSRVSEQLVSSHMATLLAVSCDHEVACVTYVSEPALAQAAQEMWFTGSVLAEMILPVVRDFVLFLVVQWAR